MVFGAVTFASYILEIGLNFRLHVAQWAHLNNFNWQHIRGRSAVKSLSQGLWLSFYRFWFRASTHTTINDQTVIFKVLDSDASVFPEKLETMTKPSRRSQPAPLCRDGLLPTARGCNPHGVCTGCVQTDLSHPLPGCSGKDQMHHGPSQLLEQGERERRWLEEPSKGYAHDDECSVKGQKCTFMETPR